MRYTLLLCLFQILASQGGPVLPPLPQPIGPLSIDVALHQPSEFDGVLHVAAVVPYELNYPSLNQSFDAIKGWKLWEYIVNNVRSPAGIQVAGKNYAVNVTIINCKATTNDVIDTAKNLSSSLWGNYNIVFSPPIATNEWMNISEPTGLPTITPWDMDRETFECGGPTEWISRPPCRGPNLRRYETLWGILPPSDLSFGPALELLKIKGASTISLWSVNTSSLLSMCHNAEANAIRLGYKIQTPSLSDGTGILIIPSNPSTDEIRSLLKKLVSLNADVVVAGTFSPDILVTYIRTMKELNYAPQATVLSNVLSSPILHYHLKADLYYYLGYTLWSPQCHGVSFQDSLDFPPTSKMSSSALFSETYSRFWSNETATEYAAMAYAGCYAYESTVEFAGNTDRGSLQTAFPLINGVSFFGGLSFNGYGMNNRSVVVTQVNQTGKLSLVYPFDTAVDPIVYPFVLWNAREIIMYFLGTTMEQAMFGMFIIEVIFILLSLAFVIKNWQNWTIRGSPVFLCFMLVGCFLVFLTVPSWMLYSEITYCYLRIWVLTYGLTLMIGSIILLLVLQMFPNISDKVMLIILGVFLLIDTITLSVGNSITDATLKIVVPSVAPDSVGTVNDGNVWLTLDFYQCTYFARDKHVREVNPHGTYEIIIGVILAYKAILIVFGFYFSLYVYKHAKRIWFESRPITFALYSSILWTLIGTIIVFALHHTSLSTRNWAFVLRSLCMFLGGTLTPIIMFHPDSRKKVGYISIQGKEVIHL